MTKTVEGDLSKFLLGRLSPDDPAEQAFRSRLFGELHTRDAPEALEMLTDRARRQLLAFAQSRKLLADTQPIEKLVVVPTLRAIFRNIAFENTSCFAVSQGFVDLLTFHHRTTVALRMADRLSTKASVEAAGSLSIRRSLNMAHFDVIGRWLHHQFPLDDLPATRASPALQQEEHHVFLQGMIFLLLHEEAHTALDHRSDAHPEETLLSFDFATDEELGRGKRQELAADAWAATRLSWPAATREWSVASVVRLFLVVGIGQAAIGKIPRSHPYVSNRLNHLVAVLRQRQIDVRDDVAAAGLFLAKEYDDWRARSSAGLSSADLVRAVGAFSVEAARLWTANGGDASLLAL